MGRHLQFQLIGFLIHVEPSFPVPVLGGAVQMRLASVPDVARHSLLDISFLDLLLKEHAGRTNQIS